jgi:hypothetical protein
MEIFMFFIACFFIGYKVMINEQNTPPNEAVRHVVISYPYLPYLLSLFHSSIIHSSSLFPIRYLFHRTALVGAIDLFEQNSQTSKGTQIGRTEHLQKASEPVSSIEQRTPQNSQEQQTSMNSSPFKTHEQRG